MDNCDDIIIIAIEQVSMEAKGSHIQQLKLEGMCKLGNPCTAHIKSFEDQTTKQIHVEYCFYHHNHKTTIPHIRISDKEDNCQ